MEKSINVILAEIAKDILAIVRYVMASEVGINSKTGTNTLRDSDIYRQLKVLARNDGDLVYDLMVNQYIEYIENGRRAGAKWPPVEPIVNWCRKKGIPTDNSTVFLIRRSIAENGIKPRKIFDEAFRRMDKAFENEWSETLYNKITESLTEFFK